MTDKDFQKFMVEHMSKLTDEVTGLRQDMFRMEFQLTEKIDVLFDGMAAANKKLDDHTARLERIEDKVEHHDIQIRVLDETKSNKRKVK